MRATRVGRDQRQRRGDGICIVGRVQRSRQCRPNRYGTSTVATLASTMQTRDTTTRALRSEPALRPQIGQQHASGRKEGAPSPSSVSGRAMSVPHIGAAEDQKSRGNGEQCDSSR